jgi:hypothetical protein
LRQWLEGHHSGPIAGTTDLERLLATCWHEFSGDHGGMEGRKLLGRMERVEWNPPILSFNIERHGGTVLGSSRAELQQWTLDIDRRTAACEAVSHGQLRPMQRRLDVVPLAEGVARLILDRRGDERLKWNDEGSLAGPPDPERLEREGWSLPSCVYMFASNMRKALQRFKETR